MFPELNFGSDLVVTLLILLLDGLTDPKVLILTGRAFGVLTGVLERLVSVLFLFLDLLLPSVS
jgi:hypothetical protein